MSITLDLSGLLAFDGVPVITPVLALLFRPFDLAPIDPAQDSIGCALSVRQLDTYNPSEWNDLPPLLRGAEALCGFAPASGDDVGRMLLALGKRFGDPADWPALQDKVAGTDFGGAVSLVDLFRFARLLNDGHNLMAISLTGSHRNDARGLWRFGGVARYVDAAIDLQTDSTDLAAQACLCLQGRAPEAFARWTAAMVASVVDPRLRARVAQAIVGAASSAGFSEMTLPAR